MTNKTQASFLAEVLSPLHIEEGVVALSELLEMLNKLDDARMVRIISLYYGLNGPALTLGEIGKKLSLRPKYVGSLKQKGVFLLRQLVSERHDFREE
jgi:DNA-directed RNA polymerase sigma subunit (sigma70/sigma32)